MTHKLQPPAVEPSESPLALPELELLPPADDPARPALSVGELFARLALGDLPLVAMVDPGERER